MSADTTRRPEVLVFPWSPREPTKAQGSPLIRLISNEKETSMSNEIIASKIPALNKYGQNGAQNASSDLPGQSTTSGLLPKVVVPNDATQQRTVSKQPFAPAHSMR